MGIPDAMDVLRQVLLAHDFHSLHWLLLPHWWGYSLLVRPFTTAWLAVYAAFAICLFLSLARLLIESLGTVARLLIGKSA